MDPQEQISLKFKLKYNFKINLKMLVETLLTIDLSKGFILDSTKPLPKTMLTY